VGAEHAGQAAQRVELLCCSAVGLVVGDPQQVELGAEALGRAPRAAHDRWDCGVGVISASRRSPIAWGAGGVDQPLVRARADGGR
jgi:hypothetical protein